MNEREGKRFIRRYRGTKHYFTITGTGKDQEIFISSQAESDQETLAGLTGFTRLLTLAINAGYKHRAMEQLKKSSISLHDKYAKPDLPGIIVELFAEYDGAMVDQQGDKQNNVEQQP
jgi:hypothetical protein